MIAKGIRCFGKVQGVFYRASTQQKALELNLTGRVMNEPLGTVLIHAEGAAIRLDQLIDWCKQGPQFSEVEKVEVWEENVEKFKKFEIQKSESGSF